MKIQTQSSKVLMSNDTSKTDFSIANSPKAFQILSNTLYKHKILAVVREYLANAYDAYIDNSSVRPMEVTVPTTLFPDWKLLLEMQSIIYMVHMNQR